MSSPQYLTVAILLVCPLITQAQSVQVNQQNRTIEIAADSSIQVTADRVTVTAGYHNYGPTHEAAYAENAQIAAQILKAWKDAGVAQRDISTSVLSSHATSDDDLKDMAPSERKQKQYEVDQSWKITQTIDVAEKLLDIAVDAGANEVGDPEWNLADPDAAEAQAYASALEKARTVADQMAKSFGAKTGALLYASNESRPSRFVTVNAEVATVVSRRNRTSRPDTKLLPQKIEKTGYVRAIFALE
ncbi:MAG: SIMPL domain-containing protein [Candidatus Acidiferrales bacterium]